MTGADPYSESIPNSRVQIPADLAVAAMMADTDAVAA